MNTEDSRDPNAVRPPATGLETEPRSSQTSGEPPLADSSTSSHQSALPDDLAAALRSPGLLEAAAAARAHQRNAWREGRGIAVEAYFAARQDLRADPSIALDLVYAEYLAREELDGPSPEPELAARFPDLAAALAQQVALHRLLLATEPGVETRLADAAMPVREEQVGALLAGKYKLFEAIGEGGMGSVYMAQQIAPIKRAVAVKVIKAGMDSKAVLARFEAERQALALMDHPNIARVLDAGTTESGRPFFVMELVKGVPITQYCDEKKLTARQRLELFVPVCSAIQHAHQKGIIHRDIKPNNVIVALYDDKPVPKVIDFGVAKATGLALTDKTLMTGFGSLVGTPEYMSPEQANLNNQDIDTRSDVYSLGVLLYELLTGSTPVNRKRLSKAALLEVLRMVREVEATRPSTKLSSSETLPHVAANRGTDLAKLSKLMQGELDWVVLKALEKDRTRRYETANGLAHDIQRYLADEIVEARPPSASYRLRKIVRRNRGAALATCLVILALAAGITVSAWQAVRAIAAEDATRNQLALTQQAGAEARAAEAKAVEREALEKTARQEADREKRTAEAVGQFLRDVLAQGNAYSQLQEFGKAVPNQTLREAIDRAAARVEGRFRDQPLVEAEIRMTLARSYYGLHEYAAGEPHARRAIGLYREHAGPRHVKTMQSLVQLGQFLSRTKRFDDALLLFEEARTGLKQILGPTDPETLDVSQDIAHLFMAMADFDRAEAASLQNLDAVRGAFGPDDPRTLTAQLALGMCYGCSDPARAEPLIRRSLEGLRKVHGDNHPDTIDAMIAAGYNEFLSGRGQSAAGFYRDALVAQRAVRGEKHPATVRLYNNFLLKAGELVARSNSTQAESIFREAFDGLRKALGPGHPTTLDALYKFVQFHVAQQHYAAAADLLATVQLTFGAAGDTWPAFYVMSLRGYVLALAGDRATAERLILDGYLGVKRHESDMVQDESRLLESVSQRVLWYYQYVGDFAKGAAKAEALAAGENVTAGLLYDCACLLALYSAMSKDDAERKKQYAGRAVALLTKAVAAGYRDAARMAKDAQLDSLRGREDFKKLLESMEKTPATKLQ